MPRTVRLLCRAGEADGVHRRVERVRWVELSSMAESDGQNATAETVEDVDLGDKNGEVVVLSETKTQGGAGEVSSPVLALPPVLQDLLRKVWVEQVRRDRMLMVVFRSSKPVLTSE